MGRLGQQNIYLRPRTRTGTRNEKKVVQMAHVVQH